MKNKLAVYVLVLGFLCTVSSGCGMLKESTMAEQKDTELNSIKSEVSNLHHQIEQLSQRNEKLESDFSDLSLKLDELLANTQRLKSLLSKESNIK